MKHVFLLLTMALCLNNISASEIAQLNRDSKKQKTVFSVKTASKTQNPLLRNGVAQRNQPDSLIISRRSENEAHYSLQDKIVYTYNTAGAVLKEELFYRNHYFWEEDNNLEITWSSVEISEYTYSSQGVLESKIKTNSPYKYVTSYNSDGKEISDTDFYWNSENKTWEEEYKYEQTYDGNKTTSFKSYYRSEPSYITEIIYTGNTGVVTEHEYIDGSWVEVGNGTVTIDDRGNFIDVMLNQLSESTGEWEKHHQTSEYNSNNDLISMKGYDWSKTTEKWELVNRIDNKYNSKNQLIGTYEFYTYYSSSEISTDGEPETPTKQENYYETEYTYNEDGFIATQINSYWYGNNEVEWYRDYYRYEYFYDGISSSINTTPQGSEIKIYTLPSGIEIVGAEAGSGIAIYNLSGILIANTQAQEEQTSISLDPNTLYIIKIGNNSVKIQTR